jgi:hypothetical protein
VTTDTVCIGNHIYLTSGYRWQHCIGHYSTHWDFSVCCFLLTSSNDVGSPLSAFPHCHRTSGIENLKSKLSCDRRSVGQSVLVSGHHLKPATNYSFSSMVIVFRHLRFSNCRAPSLTTGRACDSLVQFLLAITSVALTSKSCRSHNHVLLAYLRLSSLFVASYDSQSYGGNILARLHIG